MEVALSLWPHGSILPYLIAIDLDPLRRQTRVQPERCRGTRAKQGLGRELPQGFPIACHKRFEGTVPLVRIFVPGLYDHIRPPFVVHRSPLSVLGWSGACAVHTVCVLQPSQARCLEDFQSGEYLLSKPLDGSGSSHSYLLRNKVDGQCFRINLSTP